MLAADAADLRSAAITFPTGTSRDRIAEMMRAQPYPVTPLVVEAIKGISFKDALGGQMMLYDVEASSDHFKHWVAHVLVCDWQGCVRARAGLF